MRFSALALLPLYASSFVLQPPTAHTARSSPLCVLSDPQETNLGGTDSAKVLTEKAAKLAKIEELKRVSSNLLSPLNEGESRAVP